MDSTNSGSFIKYLSLIIALSAISLVSKAEQKLILLTEHYPPLNYVKNGELAGAGVEVVNEIRSALRANTSIEVMPWKRAYLKATGTQNVGIFSLVRSPEREKAFKWVGPIAAKRYGFYGLKTKDFAISQISDVTNYRIGVQTGSRLESYLQEKNVKSVQSVTSPEQNMAKLLIGRIDLWYTSYATLMAFAQADSKEAELFQEVLVTEKELLYIGFSPLTADNVVSQWQDAYEKLYSSGRILNIYKRRNELHMYPELAFNN